MEIDMAIIPVTINMKREREIDQGLSFANPWRHTFHGCNCQISLLLRKSVRL